jgi:chromosome segregation ATPase
MCPEAMLIPMEVLDRSTLETLEQDVLQLSIITRAVKKALQQLQPSVEDLEARREALQEELRHIETELARLATAIASGGPLQAFLAAVHDRATTEQVASRTGHA